MTDLHADDGYLDFYRFEHDPFLEKGPSFKFFPAKRRFIVTELQHIARYSKLMLVVTGPQGSGKTVLRETFVEGLREPVKSIVITASGKTDAASMLAQVSTELGLQDAEIADVLKHIEKMHASDQETYVVVDNAECLDESALLFLQRLAQGMNDASARIFVFSDSSICPLLEKVADSADLHHVISLEPWEEHEVVEYIEQRLIAAGQPLDVLTEKQLKEIYTQSQGWPGQVNTLARAVLIQQMQKKPSVKKLAAGLPLKHLGILAVLALALGLFWLLQTPDADPYLQGEESLAVTLLEPVSPPPEVKAVAPAVAGKIELPLNLNPEPVLRTPLAQALNSENELAMGLDEPVLDEQPMADTLVAADATQELVAEVASIDTPARLQAPQLPPEPARETLASAPEPVPAPVPVSTPPVKTQTQPKPVAKPVVPVQKRAARPAPQVVKAAPVVQKKAAKAVRLSGSAGHIQWYKEQPATHYSVQIFATGSETKAQGYVKQNPHDYHYFRKPHQGKTVFVVSYGSFPDRATAHLAINALPDTIRNGKPWIRTILSIQNEMR